MSRKNTPWIDLYLVLLSYYLLILPSFSHEQPKIYIVHVSKSHKPSIFNTHLDWYTSTLQSLPPSPSSSSFGTGHLHRPCRELIYTYNHAIHGFAARLTPSQASHLRGLHGIVSISPERTHRIYTTRTPQFLGLNDHSGLWPSSKYGDDVIIGVIDTGIWPERQSFNDSGYSPVPKRWKGICETGPDFPETSCNRKIIGARVYYKGYEEAMGQPVDADGTESRSPRDTNGHGTHCASIAAVSAVRNAGFRKYGVGVARGMASKARIAAYKVGWTFGILASDLIAGMDQAVADGVDVMSLSFGLDQPTLKYYDDVIAIATFGAMQKGILVSCAAGNNGPAPMSVDNLAPWMLNVGASTIDREFSAELVLGDGQVFPGASLYSGEPLNPQSGGYAEVVYGVNNKTDRYCLEGSLNSTHVSGKIVVCYVGRDTTAAAKGAVVKSAGGVGMILIDQNEGELRAQSYPIPATEVSLSSGSKIIEYMNKQYSNGRKPTATIKFRGMVTGLSASSAPRVASLSSRGPSQVVPEILKPDVIAPGINILAAWTGFGADPSEEFNIKSGTSMACPHVSGLAALLRSAYPNWSPAAIKSALMTTAYNVDNSGRYITDFATNKASTPFQHGSGHVNPNKAINPGLVYDIVPSDYEAFLCSIGYTAEQISLFIKDKKVDCKAIKSSASSPGDLNYPSFSVVFTNADKMIKYKRVVTNVGSSKHAVYNVRITGRTSFLKISVSPSKLMFSKDKTSLPYEITFESKMTVPVTVKKEAFGSIEWYDGEHVVRSPIAFSWPITNSTNLISSS